MLRAAQLLASLQHGLGAEPPILAIAARGPDGKTMPQTVAAMAAVTAGDPGGSSRADPSGWPATAERSFALEAARLLAAANREVAVVALLDPPAITTRGVAQLLRSLLGRMSGEPQRRGGTGRRAMFRRP